MKFLLALFQLFFPTEEQKTKRRERDDNEDFYRH